MRFFIRAVDIHRKGSNMTDSHLGISIDIR